MKSLITILILQALVSYLRRRPSRSLLPETLLARHPAHFAIIARLVAQLPRALICLVHLVRVFIRFHALRFVQLIVHMLRWILHLRSQVDMLFLRRHDHARNLQHSATIALSRLARLRLSNRHHWLHLGVLNCDDI